MKKKVSGKVLSIIMGVLIAILLCIGMWGYISGDKQPPVILIEDKELSYKENDSYDSLLDSVKAIDEVDGEVQVYVENIYPLYGDEEAKVYFTATDSSGNIAKESVIVKYIQDDDDEETDGEDIDDFAEDSAEEVDSELENSDSIDEESSLEVSKTESDENDNLPQVILTTDYVELSVGEKFYYTTYIEDLIDDKDSYGELEKRMVTVGASINTNISGTYHVEYSVKDTDGNYAEPVVLTVKVK